jgi:hypothetical protein
MGSSYRRLKKRRVGVNDKDFYLLKSVTRGLPEAVFSTESGA